MKRFFLYFHFQKIFFAKFGQNFEKKFKLNHITYKLQLNLTLMPYKHSVCW